MKLMIFLLILISQNAIANHFVMNYKNINSLYSTLCFLVDSNHKMPDHIEINQLLIDIENTGPNEKTITASGQCFNAVRVPNNNVKASELEIFSQFHYKSQIIEGTIGLNQFSISKKNNTLSQIEIYNPITDKYISYSLKGSHWAQMNTIISTPEDQIKIYINDKLFANETSPSVLEFELNHYQHYSLHSYDSYGCYHPKKLLKEETCNYYSDIIKDSLR